MPDPEQMQQMVADNLKNNSSLSVKGHEPISPARIEVSGNPRSPEFYLFFAKADNGGIDITPDAKEVEIKIELQNEEKIDRKFRLKDMIFDSELEI